MDCEKVSFQRLAMDFYWLVVTEADTWDLNLVISTSICAFCIPHSLVLAAAVLAVPSLVAHFSQVSVSHRYINLKRSSG